MWILIKQNVGFHFIDRQIKLAILQDNFTNYFIEHCEIDYFVLGKKSILDHEDQNLRIFSVCSEWVEV